MKKGTNKTKKQNHHWLQKLREKAPIAVAKTQRILKILAMGLLVLDVVLLGLFFKYKHTVSSTNLTLNQDPGIQWAHTSGGYIIGILFIAACLLFINRMLYNRSPLFSGKFGICFLLTVIIAFPIFLDFFVLLLYKIG